MDAAKAKEAAAGAAAAGHKAVQDILNHPSVQPHVKKVLECPQVQKVMSDPRVVAAYSKLSDPAVQRHFLSDLKQVIAGDLHLKDAVVDLKGVLTDKHIEEAKAVPTDK